MPRIRFRPGYQRLWRFARTALKEMLQIKFTYQHRLTRYLMRFSIRSQSFYLSYAESSALKIIMFSKLLPDTKTLNLFFAHRLIFLNGSNLSNLEELINVNDIIQLTVSVWYYIFYRWLMNWTVLRVKKLKRLIYRKGLATSKQLMKVRKQKSQYTPNWIFNIRYDISDVKPFLEVDYFTLSVYMIYDPYLLNTYTFNTLNESRTNIYRLYNWKYIT